MKGLAQRLVLKQREKETFIHELLTGAFDSLFMAVGFYLIGWTTILQCKQGYFALAI